MISKNLVGAIAWLQAGRVVAGRQLLPVARKFHAHDDIPSFSLRLGEHTAAVCNSSTPGTSGFIDTDDYNDSQMFFWLFESKNDPTTDPIILWMSGGPGASSAGYGNLMELGPCRIAVEGGHTVDNPFGWNTNASVLFVDQPVSVGFSQGRTVPDGLTGATQLVHRFLRQFFIAFPQLSDLDFYIAGESYGGSWVPALGAAIAESQAGREHQTAPPLQTQPSRLPTLADADPSDSNINLRGIMIGNGLVRQPVQNGGAFETACAGPGSLLDSAQCLDWAPRAMWCDQNLKICEPDGWTTEPCKNAQRICSELGEYVTGTLHRNPYNWRQTCEDADLCYTAIDLIDEYLNRTEIKTALGVEKDTPFTGVSYEVFNQWESVGDLWKSSDNYVNYLLDSNFRVLIYVGDLDWYCNAAGMRRLVNEGLAWYGHPLFRFRELIPWYSGSKRAGHWKSYEPLTYAEITEAGHLAPYDKGEETLTLINSWISGSLPVR